MEPMIYLVLVVFFLVLVVPYLLGGTLTAIGATRSIKERYMAKIAKNENVQWGLSVLSVLLVMALIVFIAYLDKYIGSLLFFFSYILLICVGYDVILKKMKQLGWN